MNLIKQDCSICKNNDWEYMDSIRNQRYWYDHDYRDIDDPVGFKVCKNCGYVTYDYMADEQLQQHYDNQRPIMSHRNKITGNRKNEYHKAFLKDFLKDYKKDSIILDVGCAQGSFLNFLNKDYGFENLYGTEWSDAFAFFAKYEYGINTSQEIDMSIKYDFISYYHVLEHVQNPDKELDKAKSVLNKNGYMYISVPLWLDKLDESAGNQTTDAENYYHLNHINVFTKNSFHNLLSNAGLSILKEDENLYCYTVLCQITEEKKEIEIEDWKDIKQRVENDFKAIEMLKAQKFDEAIALVPKYPDAYIMKCVQRDNLKDFNKQYEILMEAIKKCGRHWKLVSQLARLYFQFDENNPNKNYYSNNIKQAEKLFNEILENKSGQDDAYYFLGMINAKYKKDYDAAYEYFMKCLKINPMSYDKIWDLIAWMWKEKGNNK